MGAMVRRKRWQEVLIVIDLNCLPEARLWKRGGPGWKREAMIFPTRFLALEPCRTSMEGRWQPITLSADRTICCSFPMDQADVFLNHTVIEEVKMDLMMVV